MKNRTKKLFKITGITLGALIVFLSAVIKKYLLHTNTNSFHNFLVIFV